MRRNKPGWHLLPSRDGHFSLSAVSRQRQTPGPELPERESRAARSPMGVARRYTASPKILLNILALLMNHPISDAADIEWVLYLGMGS